MRVYIPNNESEFEFPEDMEKILNYLNANGKLTISAHAVEDYYEGYSGVRWCAGWMAVNDDILEDFAKWLSKCEVH